MNLPLKLRFKRTLLTRILTLFSLSSVAFVFQACYGPPNDMMEDIVLEGIVLSEKTNDPIPGIQVELKDQNAISVTDSLGRYYLTSLRDSAYTLVYTDIDGADNGSFSPKEIVIKDTISAYHYSNEVTLTGL